MLHEFLTEYEEPILALAAHKARGISDNLPSTAELEKGLPIFYHDLIEVLEKGSIKASGNAPVHSEDISIKEATEHGAESKRLGYTISQVVHGYGTICQSVTEFAELKKESISSWEFHELNLCLDIAIAEAVTEFEKIGTRHSQEQELLRIGGLAHELRNTLSGAILAHEIISRGSVGIGGSTAKILSRSLERMRDLIDRSLSEVRLQTMTLPDLKKVKVIEIVSDVEATASLEANSRGIKLYVDVDSDIEVNGDRQYLISALANLVQNAIKFTKENGNIWVRSRVENQFVILEVEDQCGGLPTGKAEDLFKPFTQNSDDKSGIGLGLTISRRAIALHGGTLLVRNLPERGCIFSINLPIKKRNKCTENSRH